MIFAVRHNEVVRVSRNSCSAPGLSLDLHSYSSHFTSVFTAHNLYFTLCSPGHLITEMDLSVCTRVWFILSKNILAWHFIRFILLFIVLWCIF